MQAFQHIRIVDYAMTFHRRIGSYDIVIVELFRILIDVWSNGGHGFLDMDEVVLETPPSVQASEFSHFQRRKWYHPPINMMSRPRTPNIEPSAIVTMDMRLHLQSKKG